MTTVSLQGMWQPPREQPPAQVALIAYRRLQLMLEAEHMDQYVTIDPATERYAIGSTRLQSVAAYSALHGTAEAYTFHIGTTV